MVAPFSARDLFALRALDSRLRWNDGGVSILLLVPKLLLGCALALEALLPVRNYLLQFFAP